LDPYAFLEHLRQKPWYAGQLVHLERVPARTACFGDLERALHPLLEERLRALGIRRLYSHQARAVNAVWRGANVVVSTPTASGKSLCYHIPVLQAVLEERDACALYLYPAKALAQDQMRAMDALAPPGRVRYGLYDGDTPQRERAVIRRSAQVLLTNPDMLHLGILPNHRLWARFFARLRYVVVDEAHTYRGVFGSHMANLLRRLRRVCARYGSEPRFILASATLANPRDLAERLTGLPFEAVTEDGSPYGGKAFAFWNPPMVDRLRGVRRSPSSEAVLLTAELLRHGVRTLTFVRTRRQAELVYRYVREVLGETDPHLVDRIAPYRGTYLPEDRRRVERALFEGELLGVVATNALELGIDVGDLDATILVGYPGSVASTWQQAGRSGRRQAPSLSLLVARDDPLDQYLMAHPDFLFGRPFEEARVAPENPYILRPHLLCAAWEAPLTPEDEALFGPSFREQVSALEAEGLLVRRGERWHPASEVAYPAEGVSIRTAWGRGYLVVEQDTGRVLEQGIEESSAFTMLHPGAVFLHQGETYLVRRLDREQRTAYVSRVEVPYYTQPREVVETRILREWRQRPAGATTVHLGEVEVTSQVIAFKRLQHFTDQVLGEEPLDLPPLVFRTVAMWWDIPEGTVRALLRERADLAGGLHACEHASIGVLPLFALCDRNDIGGVSTPLHPDTGRPQVFIHDGYPGGIGIAERGYEEVEALWSATLGLVSRCPCVEGCPGCIQSPKCGNNNQPLDKGVAIRIMRALLGEA